MPSVAEIRMNDVCAFLNGHKCSSEKTPVINNVIFTQMTLIRGMSAFILYL